MSESTPAVDVPDQLSLLAEEDRHTQQAWEQAAAAVLRKARRITDDDPDEAVWSRLSVRTLDQIAVSPLGTRADIDGLVTAGRPTRSGAWDVRTQIEVGDDQEAHDAILVDLDNGATSLLLRLDPEREHSWETLLSGVLLDVAAVALDRPTREEVEAFATYLEGVPITLHPHINLSFDPQTIDMLPGPASTDHSTAQDALVSVVRRAFQLGVRGLIVDGTACHDQGASDAQELGWAIATAVAYLRLLEEADFPLEQAARTIEFRFAVTDEQFPSLAKLRAARRLWTRVLEASGMTQGIEMAVHAVTSRPMTSRLDPWANMLRATVAAFAAGAGGADAVTVVPFDEPLGRPDAFGRRIARNTSSLLIEESHIGAVTDPGGGSYLVEKLTDDLALAGWTELGQIEAAGGALADEARAGFKDRVSAVRALRDAQVADRSRPLTGVSEFPNLHEVLPEREPLPHREVHHYGRAYEDMRARPASTPVFLATMGPIAGYTARATFITNLFAAGGVDVDAAGPTVDAAAVVAAYSGQPVVCLAGADPTYAEWGREVVAGLRAAGAKYVVLAGKPGDKIAIGADEVDDWAAMGTNALEFLAKVRAALGVEDEQ